MKRYEKITEEDLVEKIIRSTSPINLGFGLHHRDRRAEFNEFWNIDIDSIINGFNSIDKMIKKIEYMNQEFTCDFCGKRFSRMERNAENKSGRHFCSNTCGKKYSNSMALTPQKRIALSNHMKELYKLGKVKLHFKTGYRQSVVDEYMKNPRKCKLCGNIVPYNRRYFWSCCDEHVIHGGRRSHSGIGRKGRFNGIWCDSSWELAWVIYQIDHNIKFKRCTDFFEYEFEGKKHKYYPDFKLEDSSYVEIKGYSSKQWKAKINSFPKNISLHVLYENDMKPILDYVIKKYGINFIDMYE